VRRECLAEMAHYAERLGGFPLCSASTRSTPRRISASMVLSVRVGLIAGMIIIFFISGLRYYEDQQDGAKNTRCDYANDVVQ
jgi:hypothetical protein